MFNASLTRHSIWAFTLRSSAAASFSTAAITCGLIVTLGYAPAEAAVSEPSRPLAKFQLRPLAFAAVSIGIIVALFPMLWLHLFSRDPVVLAGGATYLRIVTPAYAALGFGFVIAFAAQGAGHVFWPFVASMARIMVAAGLGWIAVGYFGAGLAALSAMVTVSLLVYAAACAMAMIAGSVWKPDRT